MARNDEDTITQLKAFGRSSKIRLSVTTVDFLGRSVTRSCELASPVEAVRAALGRAQAELATANAEITAKQRLCFRIGFISET